MKNINKFWKKSLGNKGVIIGTVFGLLVMAINFSNAIGIIRLKTLYELTGFLMRPIVYIIFNVFKECNDILCFMLIIPIYLLVPVLYGLIGFLIGYLIEKIRHNKKLKK